MRKLLDTKAGATFYEEMPNLTLCTRKDCIEFIFKLKPGIFCDGDVDTPLIAHTPPFPAWKDGLRDLWN